MSSKSLITRSSLPKTLTKTNPMDVDNDPPNHSTHTPPISDQKVAVKSKVGKLDFEDANFADSPRSDECTLILSQGGYATHFARSVLSTLGNDKYAVFPLNGKLLTVRGAGPKRLLNNATIKQIIKILGLQPGKHYQDVKELRYGHLMFMVTQGHDGSHIIGLLINFLYHHFPSLLKVNKFMQMFITPLVKAVHKKTNAVLSFYTLSKYDKWRLGNKATDYRILFHVGSDIVAFPEESKYLFADFDQHIKDLYLFDFVDDRAVNCAFGMNIYARNFFFGRRPQFSAYVFDHSPYDHDEGSLVSTIIGMAQNYVGSNNINLLQPIGLPIGVFGTRRRGGKDHVAEGSNLSTQLSPITRYLFHKADERIFKYMRDDGQSIELAWFIPIIPMVLVNGFKGSGTECSSFIPKYNPRDIIANLIRLLEGRKVLPMDPWYKGFNGKIKKKTSNEFTTEGLIEKGKNGSTITVTELPVGMWTKKFNELLNAASRCGDIEAYKNYTDYYNPDKVHFEITMANQQKKSAKQEEWFLNKFKLKTTLSTFDMYLLDEDGLLRKYTTPEEILVEFFRIRLVFYEKRRTALLRKLKIASGLLKNKVDFIGKVRKGEIPLFPLTGKDDWCAELKTKGIQSLPSINGEATEEKEPGTGYDYLGDIPSGWFKDEKFKELEQESKEKIKEYEEQYEELSISTHVSLWLSELTTLDLQLDKEGYTVKINSEDVDSEIAEEAPKMKARAKRPAARPQGANKKSRARCSKKLQVYDNQLPAFYNFGPRQQNVD
ncbi:DNA topoisomerase 2 [Artemisia annua]|uniref:DNA topoisomerase (ATP-hydrolyzing) n=1 Tax=Artemisia annua TaxID=35608 RepID=A0A2U1NRJ1_ARTAN|nr:DNA topoisomerase 2 [Artemisia annua]